MKVQWSLFLLICLVLFPTLVLAQEPEATEAPPIVTEPSPTADLVQSLERVMLTSFILGGIVAAIAGGGSVLVMLRRLDVQTKDNAERLFLGLHPSWQATFIRIVEGAENAVETARELVTVARQVSDGKPNTPTPPAPVAVIPITTPPVSSLSDDQLNKLRQELWDGLNQLSPTTAQALTPMPVPLPVPPAQKVPPGFVGGPQPLRDPVPPTWVTNPPPAEDPQEGWEFPKG